MGYFRLGFLLISYLLFSLWGEMPPALAQARLFQPLALEFLGEYQLPAQVDNGLKLGGLSGLTYDRQRDQFYAISDDRQNPRFYTLTLKIAASGQQPALSAVEIEKVTLLRDAQGQPYPPDQLDPEGIALSPRNSLFISSEGVSSTQALPLIGEFDRQTGQLQQSLPLPQRFLALKPGQGIRDNLGFEALTLAATSTLADDPFRLFTAPENGLAQDLDPEAPSWAAPLRWLHYGINSIGSPGLIAENPYLLDPAPAGTLANGLCDLLALPQEGTFLSLERTFGLTGFGAKLFQVVNANATDTSRLASLAGGRSQLDPFRKQLLLDLSTLGLELDNLEGLSWGPRFADGSASLILVSDDNFRPEQVTQFLLFRVQGL
jgi:hypothetical protein